MAMVLGDNIFAGHGLKKRLNAAVEKAENGKGATVFGYYVDDPERFGIVEFDKNGKAISIEEKPEHPKSNYCVTGLYFYDNRVVEFAKNLKLSARGELEITDLNRMYLEDGTLNVELLGQGFTWLDTGTHESLVNATNFVKTVEQHQHRKKVRKHQCFHKSCKTDISKQLFSIRTPPVLYTMRDSYEIFLYCSICRPRNPAAQSIIFCSNSPGFFLPSFARITTEPIASPAQMIGLTTCHFSSAFCPDTMTVNFRSIEDARNCSLLAITSASCLVISCS